MIVVDVMLYIVVVVIFSFVVSFVVVRCCVIFCWYTVVALSFMLIGDFGDCRSFPIRFVRSFCRCDFVRTLVPVVLSLSCRSLSLSLLLSCCYLFACLFTLRGQVPLHFTLVHFCVAGATLRCRC